MVIIAFGILDGKPDTQGKMKIFEFGLGPASMLRDPIASFNTVSRIIQTETQLPIYTYNELHTTQNACLKPPTKPQTVFADYQCVLEPKHGLTGALLQNTSVLTLNNLAAWNMVVLDKIFMHQMFEHAKLLDARPQAKVFPLDYKPELMKDLKKHFQANADTFIIKAAISSHGNGVFVVKAAELEVTLRLLLGFCQMDKKIQTDAIETYKAALKAQKSADEINTNIAKARQWSYEACKHCQFMIEEFCSTKPILIHTKEFEATMRCEFLIIMDANGVKFHPINFYWKCPKKPINEGCLQERSISFVNDMLKDSHEVSESVRQLIVPQLKVILPELFRSLIGLDMKKYFQARERTDASKEISIALQIYFYVQTLNYLSQHTDIIHMFSLSNKDGFEKLIKPLDGTPHALSMFREIADAFFYSTFNPYLSERELIVNHIGTYKHLSLPVVNLEKLGPPEDKIRILAEFYLQMSLFLKHALDIPAVAAATEFAGNDITKKDVVGYRARAHSLQNQFLSQNPSASAFLPALEENINKMISCKSVLLEGLRRAKNNAIFSVPSGRNLIFVGNGISTPMASDCEKSHEALLKDWNEWAENSHVANTDTNTNINITKSLVNKLLAQKNYNRALRLIAGNKNHKFTLEAAKILLKYKNELKINIDELPAENNASLKRSALHLAAAGNNEALYVLFTEFHQANAELPDGSMKKASDLMLEHVKAIKDENYYYSDTIKFKFS